MLKRMVNALRGSVRLEVSGAFPERFLNLCAQRGIVFWNVAVSYTHLTLPTIA